LARPVKHDGSLYKRDESKVWWMHYRDKEGIRRRESTLSEDWGEAQKCLLRDRFQARDNKYAAGVAPWAGSHFLGMGGFLLGEQFVSFPSSRSSEGAKPLNLNEKCASSRTEPKAKSSKSIHEGEPNNPLMPARRARRAQRRKEVLRGCRSGGTL
jgi:hypothetical protein